MRIFAFLFQAVKILDSKRSQNVGILSRSLHVDFTDVEDGIGFFPPVL